VNCVNHFDLLPFKDSSLGVGFAFYKFVNAAKLGVRT